MGHEAIHGTDHGPGGPDDISAAFQARSEKGQAGGYAGLGNDGKVPAAQLPAAQAGSIPTGVIVMWHGLLSEIPSGWALCDGQNGTPDLRGKFVKGAAAGQNPGATGGAQTHTHASHPALSHSGAAVADHASQSHSGAAVADHASHTHQYTDVPNHTHPVNVTDPQHSHAVQSQTATTGAATSYEHGAVDTSSTKASEGDTTAPASTGITATTSNPTGGVASGTTQGPSAALAHSVTQPTAHPALSHSVTQPSDHAAQGHDSVNHEPPYYSVAYIMKT